MTLIPTYNGTLRSHLLNVPHCITQCSGISIFGRSIFDFTNDVLVSAILLPLGGLLMVLLVGWVLKPKAILDEINIGDGIKFNKYYTVTIKYIAPIAIIAMFIQLVVNLLAS